MNDIILKYVYPYYKSQFYILLGLCCGKEREIRVSRWQKKLRATDVNATV
jgi:hypothetical protein